MLALDGKGDVLVVVDALCEAVMEAAEKAVVEVARDPSCPRGPRSVQELDGVPVK